MTAATKIDQPLLTKSLIVGFLRARRSSAPCSSAKGSWAASSNACAVAARPGPGDDAEEGEQRDHGDDAAQVVDVHGAPPHLAAARRRGAQHLQVGDQRVQLGLALHLVAGLGDLVVGVGHADRAQRLHAWAPCRPGRPWPSPATGRPACSTRAPGRAGCSGGCGATRRCTCRPRGAGPGRCACCPTGTGGRRRTRRPSSSGRSAASRRGTDGSSASGSCSSPRGRRCRARPAAARCRA